MYITPVEIRVPDLDDFESVEVIEVLVKPGDAVKVDDPLVTLESDKAAMEVPSDVAGTVTSVAVKLSDRVSEGDLLATVEPSGDVPAGKREAETQDRTALPDASSDVPQDVPRDVPRSASPKTPKTSAEASPPHGEVHASPAVRQFARELGVNLVRVKGSGPSGRILKEDVRRFAREVLSSPSGQGAAAPAIPLPDFSAFGEIEEIPVGRIDKLSAARVKRSWLNVPQVTQHDEADVTDLEAFRATLKNQAESKHVKLTLLPFLIRALADALADFPKFNASLNEDKNTLIYKRYCHVAIAVDTSQGLIAPVLRDADRRGVFDVARAVHDLSVRARNAQLRRDDVEGACITITNLGGIGGVGFSPIVNAPEVAVLGVSRTRTSPVWDGERFIPRLLLPLDLSYDHRVINGADAARFLTHYCRLLTDPKRFEL